MKKNTPVPFFLFVVVLFFALVQASFAAQNDEAFTRVLNTSMADLTKEARQILEKRYPGADWEQYDFPLYVYTSDAVETGYRIAVKEPELLRNFKCYCFCDAMGHQSLLWCFLKEGELEKGFDDHGADCNVCYGQAMMALLWDEAGVSVERMQQGYEKKFERLIEQFGK
jgi:hypothetical protein